jgi:hypothetical protein
MRKFILIICIIMLTTASIFSQTDTISSNIYQFNKRLGIGTSFPSSPFEMVCDVPINYPEFGIMSIKNNHYSILDSWAASDIPYIASLINGRRSRGTLLYPENVRGEDRLAGIISAMYFNNEFHFNSSIEFYSGTDLNAFSLPSYISFKTTNRNEIDRTERMRLASNGNLGIGTTNPAAKLHIKDGDIFIEDINNGIIMKSPDGRCWKGTITNSGSLVFGLVDCPQENVNTIENKNTNDKISISPNPTNGIIRIIIENLNFDYFAFDISNSSGKLMKSGVFSSTDNTINISTFPAGLYLINITDISGNIHISRKIIKN